MPGLNFNSFLPVGPKIFNMHEALCEECQLAETAVEHAGKSLSEQFCTPHVA